MIMSYGALRRKFKGYFTMAVDDMKDYRESRYNDCGRHKNTETQNNVCAYLKDIQTAEMSSPRGKDLVFRKIS